MRLFPRCVCLLSLAVGVHAAELPGFHLVRDLGDERVFKSHAFMDAGVSVALAQARDGSLLAATQEQIFSFDGKQWLPLPARGLEAVLSIANDHDGTILLGTYNAPGLLARDETGTLAFRSLAPLIPPAHANARVFMQPTPAAEGVYFASFHRVLRWDRGTGMKVWETGDFFPAVVELGGTIYISDSERGLYRVRGDELEPVVHGGAGKQANKIAGGARFRAGWLLATEGDGFRYFDGERLEPIELPGSETLRRARAAIVYFRATAHGFVAADMLWNLYFFDAEGRPAGEWHPANYPGHLTANIIVDRAGTVFAATAEGVLALEFHDQARMLDIRAGWSTSVTNVHRLGPRRLFTAERRSFEWMPGTRPGTGAVRPMTEVYAVLGASGGDVFFSREHGGELLCQYADGRVETLLPRGSWTVEVSSQSPNDTVYARYFPGTVHILRKRDGRWGSDGGPLRTDRHLARLTEGAEALWFTVGVGEVARSRRGEELGALEVFGPERGLPAHWIRPFACGDEVLFAAGDGVLQYAEGTQRFVPDARFAALPAEIRGDIRALAADGDGGIWVATARGSAILRRRAGAWHWDRQALSVLQGSLVQHFFWDPEGWMWCFTSGKVFALRPAFAPAEDPGFSVVVRDISELGTGRLLRWGEPGGGETLSLPYSQRSLRIRVSAADLVAAQEVRYQIRLEGRDGDWSPWTTEPVFDLPALAEGGYVLHVRARNGWDRVVEGVPLRFAVAAPWFRTPLAYAAYVVALALVIWVTVKSYASRLHRRNAVLERMVAERTAELVLAQRELVERSRVAGMADVAAAVLHQVGNALTSVTTSAGLLLDRLGGERRREPLAVVADLMAAHADNLATYLTEDEKGRLLPRYIQASAEQAKRERGELLEEVRRIDLGIREVSAAVAAQQAYAERRLATDEVIPVAELVSAALAECRTFGLTGEVPIETAVPAELHLRAPRGKAMRVISSLIAAAAEAAAQRADAAVSIHAQAVDDAIELSIRHTGAGFVAGSGASLFAADRTDPPQGLAMGLHMAANAAVEMRGALVATSAGPEHGVTLTLRLPGARR